MKRKVAMGITMMLTAITVMAGCGETVDKTEQKDADRTKASSETVKLKLWVDLNQGDFYKEIAKEYAAQNNVEIEVIESESGKAQENVKKDPEVAADVFIFPHDHLGQLVDAGMLYKNEKYADDIKKRNNEQTVDGASFNEELYGYPVSIESMFLYYDKSVYSEEDLKTIDTLTSKGKVGLNIAEAGADYRLSPWFVANGCKLYGDNGEDVSDVTLNNEAGLNVLKWIGQAVENENIVAVNEDELNALQEGKISAVFSGIWNRDSIQEILGDNMGTAVYPQADFGNGAVDLKAFLGVKMYAVNSATKNPAQAMDLANYITSAEVQAKAFETLGIVPSNDEARKADVVQQDQIAGTVIEMAGLDHSVLMPKVPEMSNFWPNMNALINDTYSGKVTTDQMQEKLDKLVEDVSMPISE